MSAAYDSRLKCERCGRPAGPFGGTHPDFCDCDQREGSTFPSARLTAREALTAIYNRGGQIKQANGDTEPGWWYLVRESELEAIYTVVIDGPVEEAARA